MATIFKPAAPKKPTASMKEGATCYVRGADGMNRRGVMINGKCVLGVGRSFTELSFNGENAVWKDLTGKNDAYTNADGDSCAYKNQIGRAHV